MLELYSRQHIPQWFQKKLSDILSQPAPNSIMSRIIIRLFICSASAPVLLPKIKKKSTKSHTSKVGFSQTSCRKCNLFLLNTPLIPWEVTSVFLAPPHDTFVLLQLNNIHLISTLYLCLSPTLNLFNSIVLSLAPSS